MPSKSLESFRYTRTGDPRKKVTFEVLQNETDARQLHISKSALRLSGLESPNSSSTKQYEEIVSEANDQFHVPHSQEVSTI